MNGNEAWALLLDWSNILSILGLDVIDQVPEFKKERVIKKISKLYEAESLLSFKPSELDELVANELRELMRKELTTHARQKERLEKQMRAKMSPFKNPGVMRIDMNDIKGMPDELKDFFTRQLTGKNPDNDKEDDDDKYSEDKNSYYI